MKKILLLFALLASTSIFCQKTTVEGYIYETGNRGYIQGVDLTVENIETDKLIGKSTK